MGLCMLAHVDDKAASGIMDPNDGAIRDYCATELIDDIAVTGA